MANKILKTLKINLTPMDVVEMLVASKSSVSSLPVTITNTAIRSSMYGTRLELSNPAAKIGKWTVTTADGSATISGSISGTTDIKVYLDHGKSI